MSSPRYLSITKEKIVTLQRRNYADITLAKWSRQTFHLHVLLTCSTEKSMLHLWTARQNCVENTLDQSKLRDNVWINWPVLIKRVTIMKEWGTVRDWRSKETRWLIQCEILNWILEQKEDIRESLVECTGLRLGTSSVPVLISWFWSLFCGYESWSH